MTVIENSKLKAQPEQGAHALRYVYRDSLLHGMYPLAKL